MFDKKTTKQQPKSPQQHKYVLVHLYLKVQPLQIQPKYLNQSSKATTHINLVPRITYWRAEQLFRAGGKRESGFCRVQDTGFTLGVNDWQRVMLKGKRNKKKGGGGGGNLSSTTTQEAGYIQLSMSSTEHTPKPCKISAHLSSFSCRLSLLPSPLPASLCIEKPFKSNDWPHLENECQELPGGGGGGESA